MKRILVVEDEPHIAHLVRFTLERAGFAVRTVDRCAEALRELAAEPFDLVVLDLMLPDGHGRSVLEACRQGTAQGALPVLVLSARGQPQEVEALLRTGAADYMLKPFTPQKLVQRVHTLLATPREAR